MRMYGVYLKLERPYVLVFSTISVDGGLSVKGKKYKLSSDRDLYRLHYFRSIVDAVMVGANTVIIDDPLLTIRLPGYKGKQPYRIVIDGKLRVTPKYKVFNTKYAPTILITSISNKDREIIKRFTSKGVKVLFIDTDKNDPSKLDLRKAVEKLYREFYIRKILVEGGGQLLASLLKNKLIDELYLSISPLIIGLNKTSLIEDFLESPLKLVLKNIFIDHITGEITINYKPVYEEQ